MSCSLPYEILTGSYRGCLLLVMTLTMAGNIVDVLETQL